MTALSCRRLISSPISTSVASARPTAELSQLLTKITYTCSEPQTRRSRSGHSNSISSPQTQSESSVHLVYFATRTACPSSFGSPTQKPKISSSSHPKSPSGRTTNAMRRRAGPSSSDTRFAFSGGPSVHCGTSGCKDALTGQSTIRSQTRVLYPPKGNASGIKSSLKCRAHNGIKADRVRCPCTQLGSISSEAAHVVPRSDGFSSRASL